MRKKVGCVITLSKAEADAMDDGDLDEVMFARIDRQMLTYVSGKGGILVQAITHLREEYPQPQHSRPGRGAKMVDWRAWSIMEVESDV